MDSTEVLLIDLSSIAHPAWHNHKADADTDRTSREIVARVLSLAADRAHVAICCDSGKSFRSDIAATYKANRPERDAALYHQIRLARERLTREGFPVWAVERYEADDLIASAAARAVAYGKDVLVVSADKDLLQLVGSRVRVLSATSGAVLSVEDVKTKFGVLPSQMCDFLTLAGDTSDNVAGAKGIGPKTAAGLLAQFESIGKLYAELEDVGHIALGLQPGVAKALREFKPRLAETRALITMRTDVPLPFEQVLQARIPQDVKDFEMEAGDMDAREDGQVIEATAERSEVVQAPASTPADVGRKSDSVALEVSSAAPAPREWERQLDPRSMNDAVILAQRMFSSGLFSAYGTPQAVLSTVMLGRELGLPAMASLRTIHVIDGKHSLSASLMAALVIKSGLAEYFEPVEVSPTSVTFETKRKGSRGPMRLVHTIEMARQAWSKGEDAWAKSGWGKNPTDMLAARCMARLARLIYPDLLAGLYTPEELVDIKEGE